MTNNHQVRSVYDAINGVTSFLTWDADGQLRDVMRPCLGDVRHHWWNEAGQMVAMVDNEQCGYYGYNADGERMYKLTGQSVLEQYNAGEQHFQMFFNDAVLYVNPYMVVTPKGYTKHYYNGSRRIAAQVGDLNDLPNDILDNSGIVQERIQNARSYMDTLLTIEEQQQADIENLFVTPDGEVLGQMQWLSQCYEEERTLHTAVHCEEDLLASLLIQLPYDPEYPASDIYYYHSDHLGSASWITKSSGEPVQYIHYMPYGELWKNQQRTPYNERFKFTGKERDEESGYDYFGARNYTSDASIWTSPDPLLDKYPYISPYAYCNWSPINYVDPDGREWKDMDGNIIKDHSNIKAYIFYNKKDFSPQTHKMYSVLEKKYGKGTVALSDVCTKEEFQQDWQNMASQDVREVNINHHGNNQTIILNSSNKNPQYLTSTGDGLTNVLQNKAMNIQDLGLPIGTISNARLNLHTCKSNSKTQHTLIGSKLTLMQAFYNIFPFKEVKGSSAGVSYNRFTLQPEPQFFWQSWDYLRR